MRIVTGWKSANRPVALALLGLCLLAGQYGLAESSLKGTRPNVVFFLADDQSQFDYSAYGNEKAPTPTTDAFSKDSLVFENAYTGQAICAPSRSMLYTGLYPIRNGCFLNHTEIRPKVRTLPAYLQQEGYEVILAGKSHVGPSEQFKWTDWFQPVEKEGTPRPWIPIKQIGDYFESAKKPFCMMVTSEYPHGPYFKETPFAADEVKLQPFREDTPSARNYTAQYYASIAEGEREFAAVLELLDKSGLSNNTVVIYSSDHGVFRGKFTIYDSGLNVPFIVRWPGKIQPGRTDALISFIDFLPTVMELAGAQPPEGIDGSSLLAVLEGRTGKHHEYVYGVTQNQGIQNRHVFPQRSVHDGRYHYIYNFNSMDRLRESTPDDAAVAYFLQHGAEMHPGQPEEELFDTEKDPNELKNLSDNPEMTEIKARLRKELFRWMKQQKDYLSEDGRILFLKPKMHRLDQPDERFNYSVPEEFVDSLKGKLRDPHKVTEQ